MRKLSDRYLKIVEWSDEDGCYVGTCPDLFGGGVHGADEARVYRDLCRAVEDVIGDLRRNKRALPAPTALTSQVSGKRVVRIGDRTFRALATAAGALRTDPHSLADRLLRLGTEITSGSPPAKHLSEVQGWLDDDDPFFKAIGGIVADRAKHRPRVLSRRGATPKRPS